MNTKFTRVPSSPDNKRTKITLTKESQDIIKKYQEENTRVVKGVTKAPSESDIINRLLAKAVREESEIVPKMQLGTTGDGFYMDESGNIIFND